MATPVMPDIRSLPSNCGRHRGISVEHNKENPLTRRWEDLCPTLPPVACVYTVSRDSPQTQAHWQERAGVLQQALSAHRSQQFGYDYGGWLKEWRLLLYPALLVLE